MKCSEKKCIELKELINNKLISLDELQTLLQKCFDCYIKSANPIAKNTSQAIDILFAEMLIDKLHKDKKEKTISKKMNGILKELKKEIVHKNCMNKDEEQALVESIQKAVNAGEVYMQNEESNSRAKNRRICSQQHCENIQKSVSMDIFSQNDLSIVLRKCCICYANEKNNACPLDEKFLSMVGKVNAHE